MLCGLASGCGLQRALELPWFSLVLRQSVLLWLLPLLCTLFPLQWWEVDLSRL